MISSQGSNQGIAANIATTGMPEKKIVSINYSGDTCMQAAPLKRASRPKDMQLYDEPSDDGIIIRKDKMTRWHEPPSEQKASFFPFPPSIIFFIRFQKYYYARTETEMVGRLLLKEGRAGGGSQNGYNGFFWKQTFSLPTLEMKINQVEFGPPTLVCQSKYLKSQKILANHNVCFWLSKMLIKF